MTVKVGEVAPDFELPGELVPEQRRFRMYRLSDALGESPLILHFFPAPFTRGCTVQMTEARDHVEAVYGAAGVRVWGVTGHYPFLIEAWDREEHFGFPILADYEHEVSERYVGTYPDLMGLRHTTKRGLVGVSRDGIVRYVWVTETPSIVPGDEVVRQAIEAVTAPGTGAAPTSGA